MSDVQQVVRLAFWLFEEEILPDEWDVDELTEHAQEWFDDDSITEKEVEEAIVASERKREEALQEDADEESPEEWKE